MYAMLVSQGEQPVFSPFCFLHFPSVFLKNSLFNHVAAQDLFLFPEAHNVSQHSYITTSNIFFALCVWSFLMVIAWIIEHNPVKISHISVSLISVGL